MKKCVINLCVCNKNVIKDRLNTNIVLTISKFGDIVKVIKYEHESGKPAERQRRKAIGSELCTTINLYGKYDSQLPNEK